MCPNWLPCSVQKYFYKSHGILGDNWQMLWLGRIRQTSLVKYELFSFSQLKVPRSYFWTEQSERSGNSTIPVALGLWSWCYTSKLCDLGQLDSPLWASFFLILKWGAGMLGCLVMSNSLWSHGLQPARLLSPWDSPGKNTGVGWYSVLQGVFLTEGSNSRLVHWQANSLPLSHQGSVTNICMGLIMSSTTPNSCTEELTPPAPQNVKFIFLPHYLLQHMSFSLVEAHRLSCPAAYEILVL